MDFLYLLTKFQSDEDFESVIFLKKEIAIAYIQNNYPGYMLYATNPENVEYYAKTATQGILLEKVKVVG